MLGACRLVASTIEVLLIAAVLMTFGFLVISSVMEMPLRGRPGNAGWSLMGCQTATINWKIQFSPQFQSLSSFPDIRSHIAIRLCPLDLWLAGSLNTREP